MAKRYSTELESQVVTELLTGDKSTGQVVKVYGIHSNTVGAWKEAFFEKGPEWPNTSDVSLIWND
ncbi:MAG: hypothetical protein DRI81_04215 [Chloroflexi bacterium]|nr:MAG: hypothetical protein DRI81_04215 [Chloroflexota bacterium]HEY72286.1 hypothetical protein [Thermoflexia bacterium]